MPLMNWREPLQDRLIPELRLHNIRDMQSANQYLQEIFIPKYWQKNLTVNPQNINSEFTPIKQNINLDKICVQKEYRKIRNDHTFSYGNKFYLIEGSLKDSISKQKIEIRKQQDGTFYCFFCKSTTDCIRGYRANKTIFKFMLKTTDCLLKIQCRTDVNYRCFMLY